MKLKKVTVISFIFLVALISIYADDFITQDSAITEEAFTGVWARESIQRTYVDIIWFSERGYFYALRADGLITKAELLQILAFLKGESTDYGKLRNDLLNTSDYGKFAIKVETRGKYYYWKEGGRYGPSAAEGPKDYRLEDNRMLFSWGHNPERSFVKVEL